MNNKFLEVRRKESFIPVLLVLWKSLLDFSYIYLVAPLFGYSGFQLNISISKLTESYLLLLLMGFLTPKTISKVSEFLIYLLFLTVLIPIISYYSLSNEPSWPLYCMGVQYIIVLLVYKYASSKNLRLKPLKGGTKIGIRLSLFFVVSMLVYTLVLQGGLGRLNFDLKKIYEVRETSNDLYASGIFGYLLPWTFRVFNILLIVISIQRRKYQYVAVFVFIQIIFFGLTAFKAVLIYPLVLVGAYFILKAKRKIFLFFIALYSLTGVSLLTYFINGNMQLASIFIRRTFFTPSMINFQYYEFFEKNSLIYLSNSIFSSIITYPYNVSPAVVIGTYGGNDETNANTGFLATSYMHFGFIGVIIFPVIIAMLLKFIDAFEGRVPQWCLLGMLILPFNAIFRSADLLTSLLTHGLGIAIVMIWLISDINNQGKLKVK